LDNIIIINRILKLIAITYAMDEHEIKSLYENIGSIDKLLSILNVSLTSKKPLDVIINEFKNG